MFCFAVNADGFNVGRFLIAEVEIPTDPVKSQRVGGAHNARVQLVEEGSLVTAAQIHFVKGPVLFVAVQHFDPVQSFTLPVEIQLATGANLDDRSQTASSVIAVAVGCQTQIDNLRYLHQNQIWRLLFDTLSGYDRIQTVSWSAATGLTCKKKQKIRCCFLCSFK